MADEALRSLNLSSKEVGRFAKAMKDPQFMKLLHEYAQEISEPMSKEEAESYVKMVEESSKSGKFSMEGKVLVVPSPDFCVKTKNHKTGCKFFINICYADKMDKPESRMQADGSGVNWHIPYSLSPVHKVKDKGGLDCSAVDYVVNEEVCRRCEESKRFKQFVAETAIDSVMKQYNLQVEREFSFPKLKYKGPTKNPKMLTIPSSKLMGFASSKEDMSLSMNTTQSNVETVNGESLHKSCQRNDEKSEHGQQNKIAAECTEIRNQIREPNFEIVYRNGLDIGKFWMDSNLESKTETDKPKEILLRVLLPEVVLVVVVAVIVVATLLVLMLALVLWGRFRKLRNHDDIKILRNTGGHGILGCWGEMFKKRWVQDIWMCGFQGHVKKVWRGKFL